MKVTVIPIVVGAVEMIPKWLVKGTGRHRNQISRHHQDYSITKIGQNTGKSPGDLRRLAVTQTLLRNHQLTLGGKTFKEVNNNYHNPNHICVYVCCICFI